MITFKCKMCGGDLRFEEGARTCECEYCGSVQTLPKLDSGRRANLYDRANHFRRANEYDKAMGIYEQILQEDRTDAEAYWSLVLCRYGIEYVEDPDTGRRVPTVNRTQFSSILADEDYKSALEYADGVQRGIYENEAKAIDTIQKGILDISRKEEPFDVFICYKETDANGRRTPDSVLANDLYHALTREGFKVFFSRITLEDKLGQQYEPYIFAALNSAKVMVALGTKAEYFNAVWVKNEWSRYLSLIRAGQDKTLVPAYKDMDPYDLPEEFSHLQALDMGKLGFVQDLIHGIKKLARKDEKKADPRTAAQMAAAAEAAPLLKRAYIFMEDGDWDQASAYLERVLDKDPENADAYVGQVLVTNRMKREEELGESLAPYEESPGWQKALRFASPERRKELDKLVAGAKAARERARQEKVYQGAVSRFNAQAYDQALADFKSIPKYKDAADWIDICEKRLKEIADKKERERKNGIYRKAESLAASKNDFESQQEAAELFESLGDFGDAPARSEQCWDLSEKLFQAALKNKRNELDGLRASAEIRSFIRSLSGSIFDGYDEGDELRRDAENRLNAALEEEKKRKAQEEEEKKQREMILQRKQEAEERKKKRLKVFAAILVVLLAAGTFGYFKILKPKMNYDWAIQLTAEGKFDEAEAIFIALGDYGDSADRLKQISADRMYAAGKHKEAYYVYATLPPGYKTHDSDYTAKLSEAERLLDEGGYDEALAVCNEYSYLPGADTLWQRIRYQKASSLAANGDYDGAIALYEALNPYEDSGSLSLQAQADRAYARGDLAVAADLYAQLDEKYQTHADEYAAKYTAAEESLTTGKYDEAMVGFLSLGTYADSADRAKEATYAKADSLCAAREYDAAVKIFEGLGTYSDSTNKAKQAKADGLYALDDYAGANSIYSGLEEKYRTHADDYAAMYAAAEEDRILEEYDEAIAVFAALGEYGGSADKAKQAAADKLFAAGDYKGAFEIYDALGDDFQTHSSDYAAMYTAAEKDLVEGKYDEAIAGFTVLGGYSDAESRVTEATYKKAAALAEQGEYEDALAVFISLDDYRDSGEQAEKLLLRIADAAYADGDYAKALDHYIQLEQTDELKAREYDLAQACYENGHYELAVHSYEMLGQYQLSVSRVLVARYAWANQLYENGEYEKAAEQFGMLGDMSDSAERAKQAMYMRGAELLEGGEYDVAKAVFVSLGSYSDAAAKAKECDEKKTYVIYSSALTLLEKGKYDEAKEIFVSLGAYRDSDTMASECDYRKAKEMMANGDHQAAIHIFDALGSYNDSKDRANACRHSLATEAMNAGDYPLAAERFRAISGYNDSAEQARKCMYLEAERLYQDKKYEEALSWYEKADGYGESAARISECGYQVAEDYYEIGEYGAALSLLENETEDRSLALVRRCHFALGEEEAVRGNIPGAVAYYAQAVSDADAQQRLYAIGADFAAVNENEKAIEVLWLSGDYEPSKTMLSELSGLLAASGRPMDAIMGYWAVEDDEKAAAVFGTVTKEEWTARVERYDYCPSGDFRTEMKYRCAGMLMKQGKYDEAFAEYLSISGYKDVDSLLANDHNLAAAARDAKYSIGNYVTFGHYPQTSGGNDNTPIEWLVVARDGKKALLLSRYGLDAKPYNEKWFDITWEKCTLRTWLNGTFQNKAFTAEEQKGILLTNVDNGSSQSYSGWSTNGGNNTQDRVFLLSYAEANKYLDVTYDDRKNTKSRAEPTAYAIKQGAYTNSNNKTADGAAAGWWWLRSPGDLQLMAAFVGSDGSLDYGSVLINDACVRPALWINLESGIF